MTTRFVRLGLAAAPFTASVPAETIGVTPARAASAFRAMVKRAKRENAERNIRVPFEPVTPANMERYAAKN